LQVELQVVVAMAHVAVAAEAQVATEHLHHFQLVKTQITQ
jgi:hypothetical protein